jgi:hypothetical protein
MRKPRRRFTTYGVPPLHPPTPTYDDVEPKRCPETPTVRVHDKRDASFHLPSTPSRTASRGINTSFGTRPSGHRTRSTSHRHLKTRQRHEKRAETRGNAFPPPFFNLHSATHEGVTPDARNPHPNVKRGVRCVGNTRETTTAETRRSPSSPPPPFLLPTH